jgi:3-oxoacyl-[acyl-carrier protein] reductase
MIAQILSREGRLDILVNNAGDPVEAKDIEQVTPEIWDQAMAVNLRSVFLCAQAAIPSMKKLGRGRIINISSIGAVAGGSPRTLPYAAAKGGVETLTRGLARVLGPYGITVNAVAPGSIRTAMQEKFASPDYIESKISEAPLRRCGIPEEVAAAVLFLASDAGGFITGQVVRVDGGRSA